MKSLKEAIMEEGFPLFSIATSSRGSENGSFWLCDGTLSKRIEAGKLYEYEILDSPDDCKQYRDLSLTWCVIQIVRRVAAEKSIVYSTSLLAFQT